MGTILSIKLAIRSCIQVILCFALIFLSAPAYALYYFSYTVDPNNTTGNTNLNFNGGGFSFSDTYDRYSESTWQVESAVDDGNGGVAVSYSFGQTPWDSYYAGIHFSFQILSDDGNLNPEPVSVDAWGGISSEHQMYFDPYRYTTACCSSGDVSLESPMWSFYEGDYGPQIDNLRLSSGSDSFDGSYTLYSNTTYDIFYRADHYVESYEGFGAQYGFDTWEEFNEFMAESGGSGGSYASAHGFTNFSLVLSSNVPQASVPEPPIMILLTIGLAGFFGIRKKLKT